MGFLYTGTLLIIYFPFLQTFLRKRGEKENFFFYRQNWNIDYSRLIRFKLTVRFRRYPKNWQFRRGRAHNRNNVSLFSRSTKPLSPFLLSFFPREIINRCDLHRGKLCRAHPSHYLFSTATVHRGTANTTGRWNQSPLCESFRERGERERERDKERGIFSLFPRDSRWQRQKFH